MLIWLWVRAPQQQDSLPNRYSCPKSVATCMQLISNHSHYFPLLIRENPKIFSVSKGSVTIFSDILRIFCAATNGDCSRKCRGHQTMTVRSAARTTSPSKLSHVNVVFLEPYCRFPRSCGRHYFVAAIIFPTQNGFQKSPIIVTLPL